MSTLDHAIPTLASIEATTPARPTAQPRAFGRARLWLHRWTIFTLASTFVLLSVGGQVTSYDVGMAVPDWPATFGQNMLLYNFLNDWFGIKLEHTHRLLGSFVGTCVLVLAAWVWWVDPRRWMTYAALGCVALVSGQGLLGGMRVIWDRLGIGREIAVVHAVTAEIFVVAMTAMVLWTAPTWERLTPAPHRWRSALRTMVVAAFVLLFCQITWGAMTRHLGAMFVWHAAGAGLWVLVLGGLLIVAFGDSAADRPLRRPAQALGLLTTLQLILGVLAIAATGLRPQGPIGHWWQAAVPTLHLLVGAGLVVSLTAFALIAHRCFGAADDGATAPHPMIAKHPLEAEVPA